LAPSIVQPMGIAVAVTEDRPLPAERVHLDNDWDEGLDGRPDGIEHFGVERGHDGGQRWSGTCADGALMPFTRASEVPNGALPS
jgi:hypothetical protein